MTKQIGNYVLGPKVRSGAFGLDTILIKYQNGDSVQYYQGRHFKGFLLFWFMVDYDIALK